jgi:N-acetylmuramoyl-L-alanine amidase
MNSTDSRGLRFYSLCGALFLISLAPKAGADNPAANSAILRFTDKAAQASVPLLKGQEGKTYLPLLETAKFYGVEIQKDDLDGKITLQKGGVKVRLMLSQPLFLLMGNQDSYPMDPLEMVNGEVGLPPESAEDIFSALLDTDVRWDGDQQTLAAGEVNAKDLRQEILKAKAIPASAVPAVTPSKAQTELVLNPGAPVTENEEETPETETAPPPPPSVVEAERVSDSKKIHIRRIIIDPGHGGKDYGASGYDDRYFEKQATLEIANKVAQILQIDPHLEIFMTRKSDRYITLKYRTDFANSLKADLFVSIHCNSNPKSRASGTETYVYGARASNQVAAYQASRENGKNDYKEFILNDLLHNSFSISSHKLADEVDRNIRKNLGQPIRRIQTAPFYVLCRVNMPSILIETAFISNPSEEKKLRSNEWQNKIARSIADGILAYRDKVEKSDDNRQAKL